MSFFIEFYGYLPSLTTYFYQFNLAILAKECKEKSLNAP
jgi:hypothetical protein